MRGNLFLNSIKKRVKATKVFSRKLAVNFQLSTTVHGGSVSKKCNSNNLAFRKGYGGPPPHVVYVTKCYFSSTSDRCYRFFHNLALLGHLTTGCPKKELSSQTVKFPNKQIQKGHSIFPSYGSKA